MKQKSKKMQRIDAKYSQLRRVFLTDYPMCQAALSDCTLSLDISFTSI